MVSGGKSMMGRRIRVPGFVVAGTCSVLLAAAAGKDVVAAEQVAAAATAWPAEVSAIYKVSFAGIDIGTFRFQSKADSSRAEAGTYALSGQARIKGPLGTFDWNGTTNSAGSTAPGGPKPQAYTFNFDSSALIGKKKTGAVKLGFMNGAVSNVSVLPLKPPAPDMVPIKDEHKRNVLDPLSAVMALALSSGQKPCDRKLSIFDGKQRFDLALSFRRQQRIAEARPSGQPGVGFVCSVRYKPIAGYRNNEETEKLVTNGNMEITLRPVPSANLMVPYHVSIPTGAGTATLTAQRIEITTRNRGLIALTH